MPACSHTRLTLFSYVRVRSACLWFGVGRHDVTWLQPTGRGAPQHLPRGYSLLRATRFLSTEEAAQDEACLAELRTGVSALLHATFADPASRLFRSAKRRNLHQATLVNSEGCCVSAQFCIASLAPGSSLQLSSLSRFASLFWIGAAEQSSISMICT